MKKFYIFPVVFVLGWVLAACVTPPTEEMNRAEDAVLRAENDPDAIAYAPNTLIRARDSLTRMQSEADAKRYDVAKNFAAEAINFSERAIAEGRAGAERTRSEAANLINGLQSPLAEISRTLDFAREADDIDLDFDALSRDMDSTLRSYDDAQQSFEADDYSDAIAKGQSVRSNLSDINARVNEAAQDISRKK